MNFKPGDKARLVVAKPGGISREARPYIGTEVTVTSELKDVWFLAGGKGYDISTHDGLGLTCIPECLERPKPPHEKKVAWEVVPFWRTITAPKKAPVEPVTAHLAQPTAARR
jgi:hypothetical protein